VEFIVVLPLQSGLSASPGAPFLLAGLVATHCCCRESAVWRDRNTDEVRQAQRHAIRL